jgi:hypothetical protein
MHLSSPFVNLEQIVQIAIIESLSVFCLLSFPRMIYRLSHAGAMRN